MAVLVFGCFSGIVAWRCVKIFFKQPRKVVDRAETESVCDLADCVLILADQLFTFLKFNIEQIVLWRGVQVSLEQRLQRLSLIHI